MTKPMIRNAYQKIRIGDVVVYATNEVYEWARRQGTRVLVIKGDSRAPAILGSVSPIDA